MAVAQLRGSFSYEDLDGALQDVERAYNRSTRATLNYVDDLDQDPRAVARVFIELAKEARQK